MLLLHFRECVEVFAQWLSGYPENGGAAALSFSGTDSRRTVKEQLQTLLSEQKTPVASWSADSHEPMLYSWHAVKRLLC